MWTVATFLKGEKNNSGGTASNITRCVQGSERMNRSITKWWYQSLLTYQHSSTVLIMPNSWVQVFWNAFYEKTDLQIWPGEEKKCDVTSAIWLVCLNVKEVIIRGFVYFPAVSFPMLHWPCLLMEKVWVIGKQMHCWLSVNYLNVVHFPGHCISLLTHEYLIRPLKLNVECGKSNSIFQNKVTSKYCKQKSHHLKWLFT